MFPLHDRTRRRLALVAFGVTCLLPTLLILVWGIGRQMPWQADAESRRLEGMLGLQVRIDRVRNLRPGVRRYEGFALHDPETGQRLFRCEHLEIRSGSPAPIGPATVVLHSHQPVVDEDGAAALYQLLSRAMQGQFGRAPLDVRWTADELTVGEGGETVALADLSGHVQSHPDGVKAQMRFRLADAAAADPAHVEVHRNRSTSPPGLELKLYTGAAPLPCRLLATWLPAFEALGPECRFRGYVQAGRTTDGWHGELTGHFADVDLGRLARERFAQPFAGLGQVTVERARFAGSRVEEATGGVSVGPGAIGRALLHSATAKMSLVQSTPLPARDDPVPFRQLAAAWHVDADGLRLEGRCSSAGPRTLLAGVEPWQVAEPVVQPLPVAALVRALSPDLPAEVPATPESAWLLRHLPLPEADSETAVRRSAERLR